MVHTLTEFAVATQKVETEINHVRILQGLVEEAERNLVQRRTELEESREALAQARDEFFSAYPELIPVSPAVTGTSVAGAATIGGFTPVVVDDEDAVPGPDGPGTFEFKET